MKFTTIFASALAIVGATAAAIEPAIEPPAERSVARRTVDDVARDAEIAIQELEAQACDVWACIVAVAPVLPVCAAALIEPTPIGEIACIIAVANLGANTPPACQAC